jgi:uncharacterized membrane protein YdjX (TVP38/TMEM64 family)
MKISLTKKRFLLPAKIFLGLLLLVLFACALYWFHEGAWRETLFRFRYFLSFKRIGEFILSFGAYSKIVFVLFQGAQVVCAPIPGEVSGFVGGYLFGIVLGTVLSSVGLVIGSIVAFEISRIFGVPLVKKVVKEEMMDRFDHFVTHRGLHAAFILFLIPGFPKDSLCYLLGLTHLRRFDFLMMNLFGRLPGTIVLTIQGAKVQTGNYGEFFFILAASIVLSVCLFLLRERIAHAASWILHVIKARAVSTVHGGKQETREGLNEQKR